MPILTCLISLSTKIFRNTRNFTRKSLLVTHNPYVFVLLLGELSQFLHSVVSFLTCFIGHMEGQYRTDFAPLHLIFSPVPPRCSLGKMTWVSWLTAPQRTSYSLISPMWGTPNGGNVSSTLSAHVSIIIYDLPLCFMKDAFVANVWKGFLGFFFFTF